MSIRFKIPCVNAKECHNEGAFVEYISHTLTDDQGEVVGEDYSQDYRQCEFCYGNKSSIFNGGSEDFIDVQGIYLPFKVLINNIETMSFGSNDTMHGNTVAIYRVQENETYKFFRSGFCLKTRIFIPNEQHHDIDHVTHTYLYLPKSAIPNG